MALSVLLVSSVYLVNLRKRYARSDGGGKAQQEKFTAGVDSWHVALGKGFALKLTAVLSDLWPSHLPCTITDNNGKIVLSWLV